LLVLVLIGMPTGCTTNGDDGSSESTPKNGFVEVGFVGVPPQGFHNVLLNVSAVRMNPDADAGPNDDQWVNIPVPPGVGQSIAAKPGNLQIDLNTTQSLAALFNTGNIPTGSYAIVEVQLDTTTPGTLVPNCTSGGTGLEGCIGYPIALQNPSLAITDVPASPIQVSKNNLTPLVLQLTLSIKEQPTVSGGTFVVSVEMDLASQQTFLGTVAGNVNNAGNQSGLLPPSVGAVLTGTNTIIASAMIVNGAYSLALPGETDLGTAYDIYTFGSTITFEAVKGVTVFPNMEVPLDFSVTGNQTTGNISGTITDGCSGQPIVGATVEILVPEISATDCAATPEDCIAVATANTDNSGFYPLPGSSRAPAPFVNLPTGIDYTLRISASGYDTLFTTGKATSSDKSGNCPASSTNSDCSFALTTAFINGTVTLDSAPPAGTTVNVQVLAEEAGTNNLVGALGTPLQFKGAVSSLDFILNVPSAIASFDLIAVPIDLFLGASDPFPGHTLEVAAGASSGGPSCVVPAAPTVVLGPMACTGHGSISGTAINPDSQTSVLLLKDGVQLMESAVGPLAPAPAPDNVYGFCAPPDSYTVQRLEAGSPVGASAAVGAMAVPTAQATPCPTTCSFPDSTCPGVCVNTVGPQL
jgi:hypothetical protein